MLERSHFLCERSGWREHGPALRRAVADQNKESLVGASQLGKDWCLEFGRHDGIRTYAVLKGECWFSMEGIREPVRGKARDCLLLPFGRPFRVGSNLQLPAMNADEVALWDASGVLQKRYAGDTFAGLGSHFTISGEHSSVLTAFLPPVLHTSSERDKAVLRWTLDLLAEELRESKPGGSLVVQQLSTLRVHLAETSDRGVGWLYALRDRRMQLALAAMHNEPGHRWTVQSLGERAGMSRTSFAIRFRETVGKGSMECLTDWRMMLATERLTKSSEPLSIIAGSLGYESDSAFSTVFKRVMQCSPRQYLHASRECEAECRR